MSENAPNKRNFWTRRNTEYFIKLYKQSEWLYDAMHKDFHNQARRTEAYESLLQKMKKLMPKIQMDDIHTQINSMHEQIGNEFYQIEDAEATGTAYVPELWCFEQLKFLFNHMNGLTKDEVSSIDLNDTDTSIADLSDNFNSAIIKSKISSGELKINSKVGRSKVWTIYAKISNTSGEELPNVVYCRICNNVYRYNGKSTSNLVRHKCYIAATNEEDIVRAQVSAEVKAKGIQHFTEWIIKNCRPTKIMNDSGFEKLTDYFISIGASYGRHVDLKDLLPDPKTITQNINKVYHHNLERIKTEVNSIKSNGFGLTADIWTDSYLKKTYIALTIHYIKEAKIKSRLLGMKSMEDENFTRKVKEILKDFYLELDDDKLIIVTDCSPNMVAPFRNNNRIFCISHLLHNAMEQAMHEVDDIAQLALMSINLSKYLQEAGPNSDLQTTFKSVSPSRWNKMYYLFVIIERNWNEIQQLLQQTHELMRIENIDLNILRALIKFLDPFQETFKKLEEQSATIHLVFVYIYRLKKICNSGDSDLEVIKMLKEKLRSYLDTVVLQNLTLFHKIALFLFPPANKLIQFSEEEKKITKDECKRIMRSYLEEMPEPEQEDQIMAFEGISSRNCELFSDFLHQPITNNSVDTEMMAYESLNTIFYDDFNILQWWEGHRTEFPVLFKVSCKILSTPATIAASERVFSLARNLIFEKKYRDGSSDIATNEIMFLNFNIDDDELQKEIYESTP